MRCPRLRNLLLFSLVLGLPWALGSCGNNVGRIFDPGFSGGGGNVEGASIQAPPAGGIVLEDRPRVVRAAPAGNGQQITTPICVLFSESMNLASLQESEGEEPSHLYVRAEGTTEALRGSYSLLLGGRLLVFRPTGGLPPNLTYEIVAGSTCRDLDRATVANGGVLETFTTDASNDSPSKVVFSYPENGEDLIGREDSLYAVFGAPVDPTTVTSASLYVQESSASSALAAGISYPLNISGAPDPRIVRLQPNEALSASTRHDFVFTDDIQVGDVKIDPGSQSPPVRFTTMAPLGVESVAIGNPQLGFETSINRSNLETLILDVELPASTLASDDLLARVYGVESSSSSTTELSFIEKQIKAGIDGAGTVQVSLAGSLGTVASPEFKDGELTVAVLLSRGSARTGFALVEDLTQDSVPPTLTELGPPSLVSATNLLTDLAAPAIHGTASEELGALTVTVGSTDYELFASSADGRFISKPFFLLRAQTSTGFDLTFRDKAGNSLVTTVAGTIDQRGTVTGDVSGGSLSVTVYDDASLLAVQGATVLIEPGRPQKPASGRQSATTDANGLATFGGLAASSYTVTVVKDGYELFSIVDTSASFLSLPLRPLVNGTATLSGSFNFLPTGNSTAIVGVNLLDGLEDDFAVQTMTSAPTTLTATPVLASRPLFLSAFEGEFPASSKPTYSNYTALLGATSGGLGSNQAPVEPVGGDGSYSVNSVLLPAATTTVSIPAPVGFDLSGVSGIDSAQLLADPEVRVLASLGGFGGMGLFGVGYTTARPRASKSRRATASRC
jgi:hypothetical protein